MDIVRNTKEFYQVSMDFWTQINQKNEVKKVIAKHYSNFRETCAKVIEYGIESGSFKKVDPTEFASFVIAVIDGLSLQWLFDEAGLNYDKLTKQAAALIMNSLKN